MESKRITPVSGPGAGDIQASEESPWRPQWFIHVRFAAIACLALFLVLFQYILRIKNINYSWLWAISAVFIVLNLISLGIHLFGRSRRKEEFPESLTVLGFSLDLVFLVLFLHFSGGALNPLFLIFFLIIIPASVLLSKRPAYALAGLAALLFSGMTILEGTGLIHHYRLIAGNIHSNPVFFSLMAVVFAFAVFATAYLTVRIAEKMRWFSRQCELSIAEKTRIELEKMHFLDVVAHDLKSPLSAIETMISSILDAYGSEMNEDTKDTLERIPRRTRDLIRFIQNLMDFSRIRGQEEIREHFRPLNFLPVVTSTVEMYMDQALDKNITMTVQAEPNTPLIMGSREHLERMAANIISNAVRYTPEKGSVKVKLGTQNGEVVLTIADSGIGIPEQDLPRVFDEFYRATNARKENSTGTGLGLPIVKFIVEKHGGSVTVNSVEGEGTVFTVRLPAIPVKQPA
ncbi:MAG: sensor histidine kinase [Candidatus Latescibacterota bacterium]